MLNHEIPAYFSPIFMQHLKHSLNEDIELIFDYNLRDDFFRDEVPDARWSQESEKNLRERCYGIDVDCELMNTACRKTVKFLNQKVREYHSDWLIVGSIYVGNRDGHNSAWIKYKVDGELEDKYLNCKIGIY